MTPLLAQQLSTKWLLDRSWAIQGDDPDSASAYAMLATYQARAEGDSVELATCFRRLGRFNQQLGNDTSALRYFNDALAIDRALNNQRAMVSSEQKIGSLYSRMGRKREAVDVLQTALERSERLENDSAIARCCNLLGPICMDLGWFERSYDLLFRGLDIRKRQNDKEGIAASTMNLASLYLAMNRFADALSASRAYIAMRKPDGSALDLAIGYLNLGKALHAIEQGDSALAYADSAAVLYQQGGDANGTISALRFRANVLSDQGQFEQAEAQYRKILDMIGDGGNEQVRAETTFALASNQDRLGRHTAAEELYRKVLHWCRSRGDKFFELSALDGLAGNQREMGHLDEALSLLETATLLRDSLFNDRTGEALASAEMKEKYDATQREKEIKELKVERDLRTERERRRTVQRNMVIVASIALVIFLVLLMRNLRHRKRLMQQQQVLHEQRVNEMMQDQEIRSLESMLEGQRQERGRIAQELHDRVGSMLSVIKMRFTSFEGDLPAEKKQGPVIQMTGMIDDAVKEVRRISHDLAHSTLAEDGLERALIELRTTLHVPGKLEVELGLHGLNDRLDQRREIGIYRIVQELVGNALKHAAAKHLTIEVMRTQELVNIIVTDDGRGFDIRTAAEGLGLSGIRKRVSELGGEVNWDSRPGQGTTAMVELWDPLESTCRHASLSIL